MLRTWDIVYPKLHHSGIEIRDDNTRAGINTAQNCTIVELKSPANSPPALHSCKTPKLHHSGIEIPAPYRGS